MCWLLKCDYAKLAFPAHTFLNYGTKTFLFSFFWGGGGGGAPAEKLEPGVDLQILFLENKSSSVLLLSSFAEVSSGNVVGSFL